ncbi:MAG: hypothetical protein KJ804_09060 [Proteobacteria bacterium]|nr:hypothetical protein [Pseudomonadota bacterium]
MRFDLSPAFIAAKDASFRRPRQLMIFNFPDAGPVYLSDQPLGVADGLSHEYLPLVEGWGELQDTVGDVQAVDSGEIRQMSITLWNGGKPPFSDYFLAEYPENVEVELYQWFAGLAESDAALVDRFVVQDPIEFDEASRLLNLDLVSLSIRYDQPIGDLLTKEAWPYAADSDIGKGIPQAFGSTGQIPTLQAKAALTLSLKASILSDTMTIPVYEDLDELLFPASGTVQIDEEKIRYSGRTANSLAVLQRGYLSEATEHLDKRQIVQVITDHTFLLCAGPVTAINNVKIEGYPAPAETYSVRPDLDPARIIFNEKPWVKKYAEATRFLAMQFDGVASGNSALQPANAFDAADLATAAVIKPGNNTLALIQDTVNRNRGEILRAYLAVEHWESGNFLSDYAEVWVSGIGVLGRLSRPNPADEIEIDADVDVDHGHSHEIGGEHAHPFTDPAVQTIDPTHVHDSTVQGAIITDGSTTGLPSVVYTNLSTSKVVTFYYAGQSGIISQRLHVRFRTAGAGTVTLNIPGTDPTWIAADMTVDQWFNISPAVSSVSFTLGKSGTVGGNVTFLEVTLETTLVGAIAPIVTGVTSNASGGNVLQDGTGLKAPDDVNDLTTDNRGVTVKTQENPSRTVVNLFDLTKQVNFNWAWFTGREIRVTYYDAGVGEAKSVFILHAFFDIEYVPTEVVYSEKVTAEVISMADRTRPDQGIRHLLTTRAEVTATDFDEDSFAAISLKYTSLGYTLDGLVDATLTVREAIKKICLQTHSRFFTSGGKLKMALREGHPETKPVARQLTQDNLQLRSISVARQPLRDISNRIQLFFKRDWIASETDTSGYMDSVTKESSGSVAKFGLKVRKDGFNFDLIRSATMAGAVADFYLMTDAWPSSFYTFMAYLDQFDLEKEDVLEVSAKFNRMNKVPMVMRAMDRIFGSAKNSSINLVRIVAENLYYLLKELAVEDTVLIMDTLSIMITEIGEFADAIHVLDQLFAQLHVSREDAALISDVLLIVWDIRNELAEFITVLDQTLGELDCLREDSVVVADVQEFWSVYGYGSGGYGQVPYGGLSAYRQKNPGQVYIFEQLLMALRSR